MVGVIVKLLHDLGDKGDRPTEPAELILQKELILDGAALLEVETKLSG